MTISRTGWFSLPFVGSAHASRWVHSHGFGCERTANDATVWIGRWQIDISAGSRVSVAAALPVLAAGAVLMALASIPRSARVRRA
jgi:hypothetical protein